MLNSLLSLRIYLLLNSFLPVLVCLLPKSLLLYRHLSFTRGDDGGDDADGGGGVYRSDGRVFMRGDSGGDDDGGGYEGSGSGRCENDGGVSEDGGFEDSGGGGGTRSYCTNRSYYACSCCR